MRDSGEFDVFYASTYRRVVGQVYAMIGELGEAEDAVAEAYARAWQRWSKIGDYRDPESWVRTVAYRIAVSNWRRTTRRMRAHQRHGAAADIPNTGPDQIALAAALQKIPADQRRAIVLHHLAGLSVQEICMETGAPAGTVKARLVRGRRALAAHVSEFADDPNDPTTTVVAGQEDDHV